MGNRTTRLPATCQLVMSFDGAFSLRSNLPINTLPLVVYFGRRQNTRLGTQSMRIFRTSRANLRLPRRQTRSENARQFGCATTEVINNL